MDSSLDALYWRDELLQILYWFHGEGLGETVAACDLLPLAGVEEAVIQLYLDQLADNGYVTRIGGAPPRYRLTACGIMEGGRRFADEFAGLTGQAHGECNNPDCACKTLGPRACTTHTGSTIA